jgi:glutamyl-tRNA synthetase
MVKTRFAPSPTGLVHVGNIRTALFNYLMAAHGAGDFLLRIEDTDLERSKPEFEEALKVDMEWLGLNWQEGADIGGPNGPYHQSERADIYNDYYQKLEDEDLAYPCFCSEEQLALSRKLQRARGLAPRYAGTCRSLSQEEIQTKISEGIKPSLRFRIPDNETVEFEDLVKGKQQFKTNDIGDFIIRRSSGASSFMFCNGIDDAMMKVTLASRGEDHLTNTPRQLLILKALKLPAPEYAHISLIFGSDGSPLSKRNGSRSIRDLREMGYLPEAIVNYLARLGHYYESNAFMSLEALAKNFDMKNLSTSPAKYDVSQLNYWQKQALASLSDEAFMSYISVFIDGVPEDKKSAFVTMVKPNIQFNHEVEQWKDVLFGELALESNEIIANAGKAFFELCIECVNQDMAYKEMLNVLKEKLSVKGKGLFMPVRFALTGEQHGPELAPIFEILGKENLIKRFEQALKLCA